MTKNRITWNQEAIEAHLGVGLSAICWYSFSFGLPNAMAARARNSLSVMFRFQPQFCNRKYLSIYTINPFFISYLSNHTTKDLMNCFSDLAKLAFAMKDYLLFVVYLFSWILWIKLRIQQICFTIFIYIDLMIWLCL
jgi:flavin reductase (DIM6/NTAB) family NADH-FMN oxidoreductase RutF